MNPVFKGKLVDALRSVEYHQGYDRLRNADDTFCCLGVACDLLVKEGVGEWIEWIYLGQFFGWRWRSEEGDYTTYAPCKETGLNDAIQTNLSHMNDAGRSFEEIATYIEENL